MESRLSKVILLFYCTVASLFITINGLLTAKQTNGYVFALIFLPVTLYFLSSSARQIRYGFKNKSIDKDKIGKTKAGRKLRKSETFVAVGLLIVLLLLGVNSMNKNQAVAQLPTQNVQEILEKVSSEPITFEKQKEFEGTIVVSINDGSPFVNVRSESTVYSEVLIEAKDQEEYDYVEKVSGFYKIIIDDDFGYISVKYALIKEDK